MADFDNRVMRGQTATADLFDAGLRSYMLRVYNYMLVAMLVTAATAYGIYMLSVTSDPAQIALALPLGHGAVLNLTKFGLALFASPLRWIVMLAPLGAVLFLQFRLNAMSVAGAQAAFWVFSALMGISMGSIFLLYAQAQIAVAFLITAAAFGGLSLYGYTTTRSLSGLGSFLIMGMWGLFIAMIVNIFLQSSEIMWIVSVLGVGIFAGLTAYDTQSIKEMYSVHDDGTISGKKSILGALRLYLDFINMFQFVLYLMGGNGRR